MSKFKFELNNALGHYTITDKETGATLQIRHRMSEAYIDDIMEGPEDTNRLVELANDFQEELFSHRVALILMGNNIIYFNDDNVPVLDGSIKLNNCIIHNADLQNVSLKNVHIPVCSHADITNSTVENFEWPFTEGLKLSHCFINEVYNEVSLRCNAERNEWFMNNRVEGELW